MDWSRPRETFHSHILPGAWRCSGRNNEEMVDKFVHTGIITSKEVEDAFRAVPRGAFVPPELYDEAYSDQPLRGDPHVHMSAPHMYATVLEALDLCPGLSFLNVGSGTGYFSSLAGYITKRHSVNHGIEVHKDLVEFAQGRCEEFLRFSPHLAREICRPFFLAGNCFRIDSSDRKYDRIYCGAACPPSKVTFILSMTKIGGFAIIPCKNKLLKIERVSPTRVKQSIISEVCFASLIPLPERESSLPKITFPPDDHKKKEKLLHVFPAGDLLVSRGPARTTLARLRALQEACECFKTSQPIPLPFCYVPCQQQLRDIKYPEKIKQGGKQSKPGPPSILSPVDGRISFFGACKGSCTSGHCTRDGSLLDDEDIWDHLQSDKVWETVLEHYYSVCSVSSTQKTRTLNVYAKKKINHAQSVSEVRKTLSYADLMNKLGLPCATVQPSQIHGSKAEGLPHRSEWHAYGGTEQSVDFGREEMSLNAEVDTQQATVDPCENEMEEKELWQNAEVKSDSQQGPVQSPVNASSNSEVEESIQTCTQNLSNITLNGESSEESNVTCRQQSCSSPEVNLDTVDFPVQGPSSSVQHTSAAMITDLATTFSASNESLKEPLSATNVFSVYSENGYPKTELSEDIENSPYHNEAAAESTTNQLLSNTKVAATNSVTSTEYSNVLIDVDHKHMDRLRRLTKRKWTLDEDLELVRFLTDITEKSSKGRCKGWFKAELIRPELFSRLDSVVYPRIGSHSADDLAFRAVALCRVAKILDSTLYLLSGPSLLKDLGTFQCKHALESFTVVSFLSSRTPWDSPTEPKALGSAKEEVSQGPNGEQGLVKTVEHVRGQHELTSKKLKLTQGLQDQYKEQQKLLKKQVLLLEEKQQLVQNVRVRSDNQGIQQTDRPSDSPVVSELKVQRQEVMSRLQKLIELQAEQDLKKTQLVDELKKLREDEHRLLQSEPKKKEFTEPSSGVNPQEPASPKAEGAVGRKETKKEGPPSCLVSTRYQLSALLPQLRFILPLCRQRWRIVQELLHSSEMSPPEHLPIVTVDRRSPLQERCDREKSVLLQVYKELRSEELNYRWNKWKYDQWWEVKFIGEGIIDQGGGFRDSLVEITDEICPPEFGTQEILPFFVRTPNNKDGAGDYQDSYVPNPSCRQWPVFEWIGKLLGAVYRSDENMTFAWPPFLWKLLVGEHVTWAKDFIDVDEAAVKFTDELEFMDEDLFLATYGSECKFSTVLSDGSRVELLSGGEDKTVTPADRQRFAALLREARMTESIQQVLALRRGLISVIPESVLGLLTWNELQRGVCGNPDVSLGVLKSACKYGDDLTESSECIKHLWSALTQFTNDERSRFLRFVTGRRRPPAPFTVAKAGGSHNALPNASTCASTIFWPGYSSSAVATARLRYAVYNCIAIDTDTSPW